MCDFEKALKAYVENFYDGTAGIEFDLRYGVSEDYFYSCDRGVTKRNAIKILKETSKEMGCHISIDELIASSDDYLIELDLKFDAYHYGDRIVPCYTKGLHNAYTQIIDRVEEVDQDNKKILQDWLDNVEEYWITAWFVDEGSIRFDIKEAINASS